jgi:single-stranded DNA-specific DHH superfamily exonuclease
MINRNEIKEIRNFLEASQNPLFFFDNDADGLCSFLIFKRAINRGYGIPIKSYPELSLQYVRRINEFNPDYVFILDKAEVSKDFINEITQRNIPIVWIDHHPTKTKEEFVRKTNYYNSGKNQEPVTYIAQKIFNRKEDLILAMIGCVSDVYMPDFSEKFSEEYPELFNSSLPVFDALHTTEIGKFSKMFNFGLMNTTTNVIKMIRYLEKIKGPYDIIEENNYTKEFHKRYQELNTELNKLVKKANKSLNEKSKILFFSYEGLTSMSAILSNQLYFENKDKIIIVAYKKPDKINLSIRGKSALKITELITEKIEGSTGGGHEEATGAMIPTIEYDNFKKILKEIEQII